MTRVSDIVPHEVVLRIANRIANSARGFARKYSTRIPKAIKIGTIQATESTLSINIILDKGIAPQILAFEKGADPHPIDARNAPNLMFWWEREQTKFVGPHVDHPGIQPRPFLEPAKRKHRQQNLKELREAVGRNLRLQIRMKARKV